MTSSYTVKLAIPAFAVALLSALGVVAYMGAPPAQPIADLASPDGEARSAIGTTANCQDSQAQQVTLADAAARALVDSNNDVGAPIDNFSKDDMGASPRADGPDSRTAVPERPNHRERAVHTARLRRWGRSRCPGST
ncbi:MAG: hypothetical protein ACKVIQ_02160 [Acidimicrobiales bacterium]